jgi:hypothetical protein
MDKITMPVIDKNRHIYPWGCGDVVRGAFAHYLCSLKITKQQFK